MSAAAVNPQATNSPRGREADPADLSKPQLVRLRDGSNVTVRHAGPGDEAALRSFLSGLCLEAKRLRFFTGAADMSYAARLGIAADAAHYGLVAHDEAGVLVGHVTYAKLNDTHAEVAIEVSDHLHGRGLGTLLVEMLAAAAAQRGITHFDAEVLCENHEMLNVFRDGFKARVLRREGTEQQVEFLTSGWRLARERFAQPKNNSAVS
ncbi:MAG TPA: GNAT family N-acetyltransferase [Solirubrobacteraceae bacterium]